MVINLSILGYAGICFPIDSQYGMDELRRILAVSDMKLFLYTSEKTELITALIPEFPSIHFMAADRCLTMAQDYPADNNFARRNMEDTAEVLFTSGTAAAPKAVMLSQYNLFHNWNALYRRTPMEDTDRIYLILPLHHVYAGVAAFLYTIISGMQIYLGTPCAEVCRTDFSEIKPTVSITVPLIMEHFSQEAQKRSLSLKDFFGGQMRFAYCGGAAIPSALKNRCIEQKLPVLEAYGLSETSSVVALDSPGNYRPGSTGRILDGLEVHVYQPDLNGLGEIIIKGGSVMKGYFRNEELNSKAFDENGYFHTGDIGRLDADGFLYLAGRKKRVILTSNGKNIYPDELEAIFKKHPHIHRVSLQEQDNQLRLTVWYTGNLQELENWLAATNDNLPKYQRYHKCICKEDSAGRMK